MRRLVIATDTGAVLCRDIERQFAHLRLELRVGPYVADDAEFERFARGDDPAGHQQFVGARDADQPRHGPGAERLGRDAAAHEDEADSRALGGDADIPLHRQRDADADRGAVNRRDDRLLHVPRANHGSARWIGLRSSRCVEGVAAAPRDRRLRRMRGPRRLRRLRAPRRFCRSRKTPDAAPRPSARECVPDDSSTSEASTKVTPRNGSARPISDRLSDLIASASGYSTTAPAIASAISSADSRRHAARGARAPPEPSTAGSIT